MGECIIKLSSMLIKTQASLLLGVSVFQMQPLQFYTCAPSAGVFLHFGSLCGASWRLDKTRD